MKKINMSDALCTIAGVDIDVFATRSAAAVTAYPSRGHAGWAPRTAGNAAFRVARLREAYRESVSASGHRERSR